MRSGHGGQNGKKWSKDGYFGIQSAKRDFFPFGPNIRENGSKQPQNEAFCASMNILK